MKRERGRGKMRERERENMEGKCERGKMHVCFVIASEKEEEIATSFTLCE